MKPATYVFIAGVLGVLYVQGAYIEKSELAAKATARHRLYSQPAAAPVKAPAVGQRHDGLGLCDDDSGPYPRGTAYQIEHHIYPRIHCDASYQVYPWSRGYCGGKEPGGYDKDGYYDPSFCADDQ